MTEVNLFRPGHIDATIPFPTEWNELLVEELRHVCSVLLSSFPTESATRAVMLSGMLYWRARANKVKLPKEIIQELNLEDAVMKGYPLMDFIFNDNKLTVQPFKYINFFRPLPHLYAITKGPDDDFNSLTVGEFEDTEVFYHKFREDPSAEPLAYMAAIMWRPAGKHYIRLENGRRVEYNAEKLVPFFKKLPAWKLYAIYCWYQGCREQLPKLFKTAFEGSEENGEADPMAFTKCIYAGAGPKNGTRENIRLLKLKEYFYDMELEAIKAKEIKKEIDNARK